MRALRRGRPDRTSTSPNPLLPVLRRGDWSMAQRCANKSVLWPRVSAQVPLAAVARGTPEGLDFLRWDALEELGMEWSEVLTFATHELARVPAS